MSRLANLSNTIQNALNVLGKPNSFKWKVFEEVNGKLTAPEIAKIIEKKPTNVALILADLSNKGLLEVVGKHGKATIYKKIPELKGNNLRALTGQKTRQVTTQQEKEVVQKNIQSIVINSKSINRIIDIGKKYGIENIDQNWVDVLAILNFIETATTKFLMAHRYSEESVTRMKWDEKSQRLQDKLYEEASQAGITLRPASPTVIRNYRDQRNHVDHVAHLPSAKIKPHELKLLLNVLDIFIDEVFEEHKKYCQIT